MIRRRLILVAIAAVGACGEFVPTVRRVEPGVLGVEAAPSATLEVLAWGGTGPTLVFLAGGGHTAHEFDEFAPRLSDTFRVIGITRRGVGASARARHRVTRDQPPPEPPPRTRADSSSTAAMRAWIERTQGFRLPESEIRAVNRIVAVNLAPRAAIFGPGQIRQLQAQSKLLRRQRRTAVGQP